MIKKGLTNRIEKLERKLIDSNLTYDPETLIPEETEAGWLIEGILFKTEREALIFSTKLEKHGVEAWLDELAKDIDWD